MIQGRGERRIRMPKKSQQETSPAVDVSAAIDAAFEFVSFVVGNKEEVRDLRLEEVEFLDEDRTWLITVSFLREVPPDAVEIDPVTMHYQKAIAKLGKKYRRQYKAMTVDGVTGAVRSMKIRTPV